MFAVDDPIVTAALHYIRNHLAEPLKVSTIAAALVVRRRVLEQKFRACWAARCSTTSICARRARQGLLATTDLFDVGAGRAVGIFQRRNAWPRSFANGPAWPPASTAARCGRSRLVPKTAK